MIYDFFDIFLSFGASFWELNVLIRGFQKSREFIKVD